MSVHGTRSYHIGRLQRGRRAPSAGNIELSRGKGASGRRYCGNPAPGAAIRVKAPSRSTKRGPGARAPQWPAEAVSNQRGGDPAFARVEQDVRALLATSVEPH